VHYTTARAYGKIVPEAPSAHGVLFHYDSLKLPALWGGAAAVFDRFRDGADVDFNQTPSPGPYCTL
jgi:hypothetical protein